MTSAAKQSCLIILAAYPTIEYTTHMNTFTVRQAAKYIARSVKTLQRLDREGVLVPSRTPTNRRAYTQEQLDAYLTEKNPERPHKDVLARVEELEMRVAALEGKK